MEYTQATVLVSVMTFTRMEYTTLATCSACICDDLTRMEYTLATVLISVMTFTRLEYTLCF